MTKSTNRFKNYLVILALLSLNIVEQAASVITATIPGMSKAFPEVSLVNIELVTTIVSIFVTVFVLVSGFLVKQIGQKKTAVLGLVISTVSSIIPAFSTNFTLILASRAMLGVGIGLSNPLAISLIGVFFFGDERAKLMGWRSAIAGIGTALMTYVAGQLINVSWHAAYLVYLLFIPTLLLFIFFVPDPEKTGALEKQKEELERERALSKGQGTIEKQDSKLQIIWLSTLIFLILIGIMILAIKLPTFFIEEKIGSATQASTAWSIYNFSSVLGGFIFGMVYKKIRQFILPVGLVVSGISMIAVSYLRSVSVIYILCVVMGIVGSLLIPYIFNRISETTSPKSAPLYTSIALVGSNLGAFVSPYAGEFLGGNGGASIKNAGILLIVLAILTLISGLRMVEHKKVSHS